MPAPAAFGRTHNSRGMDGAGNVTSRLWEEGSTTAGKSGILGWEGQWEWGGSRDLGLIPEALPKADPSVPVLLGNTTAFSGILWSLPGSVGGEQEGLGNGKRLLALGFSQDTGILRESGMLGSADGSHGSTGELWRAGKRDGMGWDGIEQERSGNGRQGQDSHSLLEFSGKKEFPAHGGRVSPVIISGMGLGSSMEIRDSVRSRNAAHPCRIPFRDAP